MEKDYSLLRPFDLEAAKRGDKLLFTDVLEGAEFVAGPDKDGEICVRHAIDNTLLVRRTGVFSMAPLCWVEGRPVYKDCNLWQKTIEGWRKVTVEGVTECGKYLYFFDAGSWAIDGSMSKITWAPPTVKREGWVNVYPSEMVFDKEVHGAFVSHAWRSKDLADAYANDHSFPRVACVRIEWEEPSAP